MQTASQSSLPTLDRECPSDRLYAWVPRGELVFLQAVIDAYEGLARIRTERHDGDRSLIMVMFSLNRREEVLDLLRHLKNEIHGSIELI